MSKWKYEIDISNEFKNSNAEETKEASITLLTRLISELNKIRLIDEYDTSEIEYFIENFDDLKNSLEIDIFDSIEYFQDEFNWQFNNLYDWADISLDNKFGGLKNCWIKTY